MLRGTESLQGTGTTAQTITNTDECRQGTRIGSDNSDNTDPFASKQGSLQQNNAFETTSTHRPSLYR